MNPEDSDIYKSSVKKIVAKLYEVGARSSVENDVVFYELDNPTKFLNWSVMNGYLLHGSTRKIYENLLPYKANDKVKESGNRKAIYITRVPMVAMFCGLTGGVDGLERRHVSHTKIENGKIDYENMYFGVSDRNLVKDKGYIYFVNNSQADEEINGEFLSYKPVCPVAIVKIEIGSFPYKLDEFNK